MKAGTKQFFIFFFFVSLLFGCSSRKSALVSPLPVLSPQRIVSLTLATDEILWDMLRDRRRLVGVTFLATDPAESSIAGDLKGLVRRDCIERAAKEKWCLQSVRGNIEDVVALQPDLVLVASYNSPEFLNLLEKQAIPFYRLEHFDSLQDIEKNILLVGKRVGEEKRARQMVQTMQKRLAAVQRKWSTQTRKKRVMYLTLSGFTAGKKTSIGDMIERSGGINVAAQAGMEGIRPIPLEHIVELNPDVFLVDGLSQDVPDLSILFKIFPALKRTRAFQTGQVYSLPQRLLSSVSQYSAEAVEALSKKLYPNEF